MLSVSTSQVPKLLGSLENTYIQIHMYSVSSEIRDGISRSLFISSWESRRSSTCHLPSHGLPWPFGGVVPPLLSTSNCFQVLWSHPVFNVKEGLGVKKSVKDDFCQSEKLLFRANHSSWPKMMVVPYQGIWVGSTEQLRSFLSHLPNSHPSWGPLSTNIMAWIAGSQFLVDLCSGKWSKIQVLSFRRWKQVPACLPRNKKIVVSST